MKKVILSLVVVATAFGASAFTNVKASSLLAPVTYYQNADNVYEPIPTPLPDNFCEVPESDPCTVTFQDDQILTDHPTFTTEQLENDGLLTTYEGEVGIDNARTIL